MAPATQPEFNNLRLELHAQRYAVLDLSRPAKSNAFTDALLSELILVSLFGTQAANYHNLLASSRGFPAAQQNRRFARFIVRPVAGAGVVGQLPRCPSGEQPAFNKLFIHTEREQAVNVMGAEQVVIRGQGRNFCAGIDLESLTEIAALLQSSDSGRAATTFRRKILKMQVSLTPLPMRKLMQ